MKYNFFPHFIPQMGQNFFLLLDMTFYHPKIIFKLVASHNISLFLFSTDHKPLKKSKCHFVEVFLYLAILI